MEITLGTVLKFAFYLAVMYVFYSVGMNFIGMLDNFMTVGSQYK
jgi:hypothetical protein